ncbi:DUF4041 domain-containing protein [Microcoleus sp. FACHB-672]|uniref:DUF4041 domain-containing protein n=1 Tax=Microcoleus sp. FACHB-672 TaxID=2692825 RepID=UPI0016833D57|nr:DUF4041 domain-containing protein [Microcoleus sp. FACHB-672]MBD2041677.1 DUF4041 domain-containing protein [Microcoleus sp. FACHB-672]
MSLLLLLAVLVLSGLLVKIYREREQLRHDLSRYGSLPSKEERERQLDSNIYLKESELEKLQREQNNFLTQIRNLRQKLEEVEEEEYVQNFGFYKSRYDFRSSTEYEIRLEEIRAKQSGRIKNRTAAICHVPWTVEGSKTKGEEMTNDYLKLLLRAFNGECDAAIAKVKYNNAVSLEKRINKSFQELNKLSEINKCEITSRYLILKLEELYLTHEFQEKKKEEDEEQKRIREQMREEKRASRELEKAKKEAEQEVKRREQALEQARREVVQAVGKQKERLEIKIQQLTQQLEESRAVERKATARVQMTKSAHVYIISNIGSFGENVYKIGVTRRLEPLDRVKELSGPAVPFPFDVHAMIFSENALEMERLLHEHFWERSVNKFNDRKEFFRVSLDEIALAVEEIASRTKAVKKTELKITKVAEAEQYRKTLALERSGTLHSPSSYTPTWDEDEELDDE